MKKRLLLILILLIIPLASATLNIDGPDKTTYNLGDEVLISGYIFREDAIVGSLRFLLNCGSNIFNLPNVAVTLSEGEKKIFPDEITIPRIIIPSSLTGNCYLQGELLSGTQIIESSRSNNFTITTGLQGNFEIDETRIQVGRSFTLTGRIYKANGQNIDGSAEIYLRSNESNYLVDIVNIQNGQLNYQYTATANPSGNYNVDIRVNDIHGNQQTFENIVSFVLINELYVVSQLDKLTAFPGDKIQVSGEALTVLQEQIPTASVRIRLNNELYTTQLKDSKFERTILLPDNIKTGSHKLDIIVEDPFGNFGRTDMTLTIQYIAKKLENRINKLSVNPGESAEITVLLYDQANDLISEDITLEIFDSENTKIFSDVVKTNNKITIPLPPHTPPGSYRIVSNVLDITRQDNFNVQTIVDADVTIINQTLIIRNIGNVEYKKPVKIEFNRGQYTVIKKTSLSPNETITINLFDEVPSGEYDIDVFFGDKEKSFKNVNIAGKKKIFSNDTITIIIIVIIVIVAVFLLFKPKKRHYKKEPRIQKKQIKVHEREAQKQEKKPFRHSFGIMKDKEEIKEFKDRILKEIKDTQEKDKFHSRKGSYYVKEDKEDNKKDLFNMFN